MARLGQFRGPSIWPQVKRGSGSIVERDEEERSGKTGITPRLLSRELILSGVLSTLTSIWFALALFVTRWNGRSEAI